MEINDIPLTARNLRLLIEDECKLYSEYLLLIDEEKKFITKFDGEQVIAITAKREEYLVQMKEARDLRADFLKRLTGREKIRLTDAIAKHFKGQEGQQLMHAALKLRNLVQKTQQKGLDFSQVVDFGLKLVNGLFSIFTSARQSITRNYSSKGVIKESYHPSGARNSGVIKEA